MDARVSRGLTPDGSFQPGTSGGPANRRDRIGITYSVPEWDGTHDPGHMQDERAYASPQRHHPLARLRFPV